MLPFDDMPKRSPDPRDPYAVAVALRSAPLPALQLAEALQALGGRASRSELFEFLDTEARAEAEEALRWLIDHAIVRGRIPDLLEGAPGLARCFANPLGLGPPLSSLSDGLTVDTLRRILRELGQSLPKSKADLLAAFTEFLRDPDAVCATLASAPAQVQSWLVQRAVGGSWADPVGWSRYDQDAYRLRQTATGWAVTRGLLIRDQWAYLDHMPAEVGRALRGPRYRAPFCPHPPSVSTHTVSAENLSRGSAASAGAFSAAAIAILDRVSRTGVPLLKSGGIGARELAKLSKSTGSADPEVRLVLELAERAGLLDIYGDDAVVSESFAPWRTGEPAARYRDLVLAWRHFGAVPTEARSEGKALPVLRRVAECTGCVDGRIAVLTTLSRLSPGCGGQLTEVGAATRWHRPLVCFETETEGDSAAFAATWREAEALGVVSQGALSAVGRLVLTADRAALTALAEQLLPATADHALFGTDLTAVVTGAPSARVTALLDSCADRESRGAATVWRLSPTSIRRALDDGVDAAQLQHELAEIARTDVPQPVQYLIKDVARRHGTVRVGAVASCLRSADTTLLAEIAVDRSLKRLDLTLLAPTVLASGRPAEETLAALRRAGYLPMPER